MTLTQAEIDYVNARTMADLSAKQCIETLDKMIMDLTKANEDMKACVKFLS